eukprot:10466166-Alexandrium_andersonii.AAC.1
MGCPEEPNFYGDGTVTSPAGLSTPFAGLGVWNASRLRESGSSNSRSSRSGSSDGGSGSRIADRGR